MNALYFIEREFTHGAITRSRSFIETDRDSNNRKSIIAGIIAGEYGNITTILEVIEDEKSCRDVTEDFARDVADALYASREPVSYEMATWLQQQLGVTATNTLNMAA